MTEPREEQPEGHEAAAPGEPLDQDDDLDDEEEVDPGQEVHSNCRCGECCRRLIVEVELADAEREPKIKERCSPIYTPAKLTTSGKKELEGYVLNVKENDYACAFLDQTTSLCSIYETRPWTCRVFDCDGERKEELVQLGILPGTARGR